MLFSNIEVALIMLNKRGILRTYKAWTMKCFTDILERERCTIL